MLGDSDETITIEDISKLAYMDQVIRETLRMFPIGPLILRQVQDDIKLGE